MGHVGVGAGGATGLEDLSGHLDVSVRNHVLLLGTVGRG